MRLIDAGEFLRAIKQADETDPDLSTCWSRGSIRRIIEGLPTIEATPVVHGRWVHDINNLYGCSECMSRETMSPRNPKKFCPNCGARMDGDGNA